MLQVNATEVRQDFAGTKLQIPRERNRFHPGFLQFEERLVDANPAWWKEAVALAATVPILVSGGRVEVGWEGEMG